MKIYDMHFSSLYDTIAFLPHCRIFLLSLIFLATCRKIHLNKQKFVVLKTSNVCFAFLSSSKEFFIFRRRRDNDDDRRARTNFGHTRRKSQRRRLICQFDRITKLGKGQPVFLQSFLQKFHRHPFEQLADALKYEGTIDDQIDFIDTTATKYQITPLIIAAGKGSLEKVKVLLVHGANPNKQCATGFVFLSSFRSSNVRFQRHGVESRRSSAKVSDRSPSALVSRQSESRQSSRKNSVASSRRFVQR